jgi:hypothetical protein
MLLEISVSSNHIEDSRFYKKFICGERALQSKCSGYFAFQNFVLSSKINCFFVPLPSSFIPPPFFLLLSLYVFKICLPYLFLLFVLYAYFLHFFTFSFILIFFNFYFLSISFHGHMSDADSAKGEESLRIDAELCSNNTG